MIRLDLPHGYHLTEIRSGDEAHYLQLLQDPAVYANTLRLPFPYTAADADFWVQWNLRSLADLGHPVNFAIRDVNERLVGNIGFVEFSAQSHAVEIGYWLGEAARGKGIMTEAVRAVVAYAHTQFGFIRITAGVFAVNVKSTAVLERAGFQAEGLRRKVHLKDGEFIDSWLYSRIF